MSKALMMLSRSTRRLPRAARRATLFMGVMACLILCTLLTGTLIKSAVAARRGSDQYELSLQSLLLAEAGVQRAIARLSVDPAYAGEAWQIAPDVLGRFQAVVVIRVEPSEGDARARHILVESQYPTDPRRRVVQTKEVLIPGPVGGET